MCGATEHEGYDPAAHVLVDAAEPLDANIEPSFLADFAAHPFIQSLTEFEDPAGRLPTVVVASADQEDVVLVVIEDDGGNANRVARCRLHGYDLPLAQCRSYGRLEEL